MIFAELQNILLRHQLGLSVEIERDRLVSVFVIPLVTIEHHVGGNVHQPSRKVVGHHGKKTRKPDVQLLRLFRSRIARLQRRHTRAIDDRVGKFIQEQSFNRLLRLGQIGLQHLVYTGNLRELCPPDGDDMMAATHRRQSGFTTQKTGRSGKNDFHEKKTLGIFKACFGCVCHAGSRGASSRIMGKIAYADLVNPAVLNQPTYEPGKPIETVAREFGLDPHAIIKLASNENPLGPSPLAQAAVARMLGEVNFYPDGGTTAIREKLAAFWNLRPDQFLLGNGSNEAMILLAQAFLRPGDEVVFGEQAFIVYKLAALLFGAKPVAVPMPGFTHDLAAMRAAITEKTKLVFLTCPNNPTGTINAAEEILQFARELPEHVILCFDEAYAEFLPNCADIRPLIAEGRKIVGARTFSKIYGLAGLRVGYLYGDAELVSLVQRTRQPFNVNLPAQVAAVAALDDTAFVQLSREVNTAGLRQLEKGFRELGLAFIPSHANFIVFHVPQAAQVFDTLQRQGVIVRPLAGYGMPDSLRVTVGTTEQNSRFLSTLGQILSKGK